jgi:hypothetical protein
MSAHVSPEPTDRFTLPDGRELEAWVVGPTDGQGLVFHFGTPGAAGNPRCPHGARVRLTSKLRATCLSAVPELEIITFGDPRLRLEGELVTRFDRRFGRLIDEMVATMRAAPGAGLAAQQVGSH